MADQWEYKVVVGATESVMNQLGEEGWELVGVENDVKGKIETDNPTWVYGDIYTVSSFIFKRRKP